MLCRRQLPGDSLSYASGGEPRPRLGSSRACNLSDLGECEKRSVSPGSRCERLTVDPSGRTGIPGDLKIVFELLFTDSASVTEQYFDFTEDQGFPSMAVEP